MHIKHEGSSPACKGAPSRAHTPESREGGRRWGSLPRVQSLALSHILADPDQASVSLWRNRIRCIPVTWELGRTVQDLSLQEQQLRSPEGKSRQLSTGVPIPGGRGAAGELPVGRRRRKRKRPAPSSTNFIP